MRTIPKRFLSVSLAALMIVILLCGCSTSNYSAAPGASSAWQAQEYQSYDSFAENPNTEYETGEEGAVLSKISVPLEDRKVVLHRDLNLETMDFDDVYAEIPAIVKAAGGYIDSQNMAGRSMRNYSDYYERSATVYARIPSERLDEVTEAVKALGNVASQSESMDDITDSYFDTETRLATLATQEARLLAILEKAETLEDIITLERELSRVRYEIESLQASLLRMDKQVAYSYLNISLREVVDYTIPVTQPKNFGQRLSESFSKAFRNLTTTFETVLFFLIESLPAIVVIGLFVLVFAVIVRVVLKAWRRRRPRRQPAQPAQGQQVWRPAQSAPNWTPPSEEPPVEIDNEYRPDK